MKQQWWGLRRWARKKDPLRFYQEWGRETRNMQKPGFIILLINWWKVSSVTVPIMGIFLPRKIEKIEMYSQLMPIDANWWCADWELWWISTLGGCSKQLCCGVVLHCHTETDLNEHLDLWHLAFIRETGIRMDDKPPVEIPTLAPGLFSHYRYQDTKRIWSQSWRTRLGIGRLPGQRSSGPVWKTRCTAALHVMYVFHSVHMPVYQIVNVYTCNKIDI